MKQAFSNPKFTILFILMVLIFVVALFAPFFAPMDPLADDFTKSNMAPGEEHLFGTDALGRDIFSRIIVGAQTSVLTALIMIVLTVAVGTLIGIVAGYFGGKTDMILMRATDTMMSFPDLILALAIVGIVGGGLVPAMISIVAVSWAKYARLGRSLVMQVKSQEYLVAAITNGCKKPVILFSHILPNIIPNIIVNGFLDIGGMMLTLASLSFLGFGVQPPTPEWGYMLSEGRKGFLTSPWLLYAPALAILIVVIIFNLFGDCLRDQLDNRDNG